MQEKKKIIQDEKELLRRDFEIVENLKTLQDTTREIQVSLNKIKSQKTFISIHIDEFLDKLNAVLEGAEKAGIPSGNMSVPGIYSLLIAKKSLSSTEEELVYNMALLSNQIKILSTKIRASEDILTNQFDIIDEQITKIQRNSMFISLGLTAIIIALGIFFAMIVSSRINRSIKKIEKNIRYLAKGDLSFVFDVRSSDEIGMLSTELNNFLNELNTIISQIKSASGRNLSIKEDLLNVAHHSSASLEQMEAGIGSIQSQISILDEKIGISTSSSENIKASINDLDRQLIDQSSMVEETSSAVTEMIASIDNVTKITDSKRETTDTLVKSAENGGHKLASTVKTIEEVNENLDNISNVAKIIMGIAAQTNLLALNAAIEAAHAGDAGKGFSVVAQEIRKLAEAVNIQSKKIKSDLQTIVNMIREAVHQSNEALEVFQSINTEILGVDNSLVEITDTMSELSTGGKQIIEAIVNLRNISVAAKDASNIISKSSEESHESAVTIRDISASVINSVGEIMTGIGDIMKSVNKTNDLSAEVSQVSESLNSEINYFKTTASE
ncbi:MAG: HAMP domain-containing protein [Spirochaetales bacterium]|nr:HAMP domain-containing protein [Spirochaetales bacterium]